jgi:hypothetical protein
MLRIVQQYQFAISCYLYCRQQHNHSASQRVANDREDHTEGGTKMTGQDYWYAWAIIVSWSALCLLAAGYIETLERRP